MDLTNFMNKLFEPLGDIAPVTHTLIVDYKLENGEDCFGEFHPIVPPNMDMESVARAIVDEMARQGKTVTSILELLNGFNVADGARATKAEIAANIDVLYNRPDLR